MRTNFPLPRARVHATVAILTVAAVLAATAGPVSTADAASMRWPGRTITYFDASQDRIAVARAVAAWNRSGIRMRFVRVFRARDARLIIRNTRDVPNGCKSAKATTGYQAPPRKAYLNILADPTPDTQACAWPGKTLLVAHELGHVLGLGHVERGCRIMNTSIVEGIAPRGCVTDNSEDAYIARKATWRCRILERADVRAAVRLYGGTIRPVRANPTCNVVARLAAPTVTASWDPVQRRVQLTIRRPPAPAIPRFLRSRADRPGQFELHRGEGACVTRHITRDEPYASSLIARSIWTAAAGSDEAHADPGAAPGSWCWSAWAVDAFGRHGVGPGTSTIVIPEDPPVA